MVYMAMCSVKLAYVVGWHDKCIPVFLAVKFRETPGPVCQY